MIIKLICCDVFARIVCGEIARSEHIVDVEFLAMLAHEKPEALRMEIQTRINSAAQNKAYDCIVLGYGLCGNATAGLCTPVPLYVPRVHDCCTLMMGGRENFLDVFGENLSTRWCACGYYERCQLARDVSPLPDNMSYKTTAEYREYLEEYGEETADYLWETMHPNIETDEAVYIECDGYEFSGSKAGFAKEVEASGKTMRVVPGDTSYLKKLVSGPWAEDLFQKVMPGETILPVYDMVRVMKAEPTI